MARFKPGQSGNPSGKKPGTRNKTTMLAEQLVEADAKGIMSVAIGKALKGDPVCLKLLLPRILPTRRTPPVRLRLPPTDTAEGLGQAVDAVLNAVASGEVAPEEGRDLVGLLDVRRKVVETVELEARLAALERALGAAT